MPSSTPPPPDRLARIARQQADSLRAAGVEWVPAAPPCHPEQAPVAASGSARAEPTASLFGEETGVSRTEAFATRPEYAGLDVQARRRALDVLAQTVSKCTRCPELAATRTQTVFGVGPVDAELCFIGEAPGADEDAKGEPFVGAAGQLLNRIIAACGMKRDEVYICNILKCRPPGNRMPLPQEAANCREYLDRQLELVRSKFICALGACAAQNLLGTTLTIGKLRGRFHEYRGIPVLCTYHPAYLLRNPASKKDVWEDMKKLMQRMGRKIPSS